VYSKRGRDERELFWDRRKGNRERGAKDKRSVFGIPKRIDNGRSVVGDMTAETYFHA